MPRHAKRRVKHGSNGKAMQGFVDRHKKFQETRRLAQSWLVTELHTAFKSVCDHLGVTMAERIRSLIESDVSDFKDGCPRRTAP